MAARTLDIFAAFEKLRAVDLNEFPRGGFGFAEVTSAQTGIGTSGADISGAEVTVTIPEGRLIRVSARVQWEETSGGNVIEQVVTEIREGATTLTRYQSSYYTESVTVPVRDTHTPWVVLNAPTAGSHTYKIHMFTAGTGATIATEPSSSYPVQLLVEDLGTELV